MRLFIKLIIIINLSIFSLSNPAYSKKVVGVAAIIIDNDTKEVLFSKNADTLNYPASLTKMMTLYIVFDYLEKNKITLDTKMKVSNIAASRSASKLYLEEGTEIKVRDAIMALIVKSANDVATVVSEHISGTERNFAKLMNKYAKNIGMKKTTFKNASGLPNRAQLTTARDMATLSHSIINNFPQYYKLFKTREFVWMGKKYKSHNKLMKSYKGADGIKTGYISDSGFQLAFSAVRENKRLIGIYFGGSTGKQRDQRLSFLMDKEFNELNINNANTKVNISNKDTNNKYQIVVGTFKYKKNAEKHLRLIRSKYPITTSGKEPHIAFINSSGRQLYESRFRYFNKKDANKACSRLKKYKRDCFIRG